MEYTALFKPDGQGFIITFPDFGWGVSQGDNEKDAQEMAVALLETLVQQHIRRNADLPVHSRPRGRNYRLIRLPALQSAKAELYREFKTAGIRKAELARSWEFQSRTSIGCSISTTIPGSISSKERSESLVRSYASR